MCATRSLSLSPRSDLQFLNDFLAEVREMFLLVDRGHSRRGIDRREGVHVRNQQRLAEQRTVVLTTAAIAMAAGTDLRKAETEIIEAREENVSLFFFK